MRTATTTMPTAAVPMLGAVRHQPIATKPAAARRRFIGNVVALLAIGIVMLLMFVWIRIKVIQLGYEVSRIHKETTYLSDQKNIIESEVLALKSPARIEAIARERFGMRLPMSDEVVFVEHGSNGSRPLEMKQEAGSRMQDGGTQ